MNKAQFQLGRLIQVGVIAVDQSALATTQRTLDDAIAELAKVGSYRLSALDRLYETAVGFEQNLSASDSESIRTDYEVVSYVLGNDESIVSGDFSSASAVIHNLLTDLLLQIDSDKNPDGTPHQRRRKQRMSDLAFTLTYMAL